MKAALSQGHNTLIFEKQRKRPGQGRLIRTLDSEVDPRTPASEPAHELEQGLTHGVEALA